MDYEKKYKEALERAKVIYQGSYKPDTAATIAETLQNVFPELKESEDEKISKEIIKYLERTVPHHHRDEVLKSKEWIAWLENIPYTIDHEKREGFHLSYKAGLEKQNSDVDNANKEYWRGYREGKQEILDKYAELEKQSESDEAKAKMFPINKGYPINTNGTFPTYEEIYNIIREGLEKQGKEKPRYSIGDVLCDKSCATLSKDAQPNFEITDIRNGMYICDKGSFPISQQDEYELVAKKIEQKSADKSKPKFKVGDWVVYDGWTTRILKVTHDGYVNDKQGFIPKEREDSMRLWGIGDARDGDVLAEDTCIFIIKKLNDDLSAEIYYCLFDDGDFEINSKLAFDDTSTYPATKEQRDTLIKVMTDAGYTFDFEKKELKKIEQKQIIDYPDNLPKDNWELIHEFVNKFGRIPKDEDELNVLIEYVLKRQKPAWSEEDDGMLDTMEGWIDTLCEYLKDSSSEYIPDVESCINWLKSLKEKIGG